MKKILSFIKKRPVTTIGLILTLVIVGNIIQNKNEPPVWTTDTVTQGSVRSIVSISGTVDAVGTAELLFPTSGIIEKIAVKEGDVISAGTILATLIHNDLKADYADALAAVRIAEADYAELIAGLRPEEREVTKTNEEIARDDVERVRNEENIKVQNAYRTLISSDLIMEPENKGGTAAAPAITGTFTCADTPSRYEDTETYTYIVDIYRSAARSGYSYRLSGVETGSAAAYNDTFGNIGTCGLSMQLIPGEVYSNGRWFIHMPNTQSSTYTTNLNAYKLAHIGRENAIRTAEQNAILATQNATVDTASPRSEAVTRSAGKVEQARARLAAIAAQIEDHTLRAPFDGIVSKVDAVIGESIQSKPILTMVSESEYQLTVRIPEIDITKISTGQKAEVVFDARADETRMATVAFISPLAEEIDGVSYFEAILTLDNEIPWIKSGLNADVDILIETREDVVRIPKRYLITNDAQTTVRIPNGNTTVEKPVTVRFTGNDGYVEIEGVDIGQTIIAP